MMQMAKFPRLLKFTKGISRGFGLYSSVIPVLRHAEYNLREIDDECREEVIQFQYDHLKANADPPSKTFDAFKEEFNYDCWDKRNFYCLAALKNTDRYMEGIKFRNEERFMVSRQKLSWFTPQRMKELGIVDEKNRKITDDMKFVLGTINMRINQDAFEVFETRPEDSKWSRKGREDAIVKLMVPDLQVQGIGIDRELFHFSKRIAAHNHMSQMFMQVEDDAGIKFAKKVGLQVVPTVAMIPETKKILVGKVLEYSDLYEGIGTYVSY